jgi:hypothetical protein
MQKEERPKALVLKSGFALAILFSAREFRGLSGLGGEN